MLPECLKLGLKLLSFLGVPFNSPKALGESLDPTLLTNIRITVQSTSKQIAYREHSSLLLIF